jgi:hypothetical protein
MRGELHARYPRLLRGSTIRHGLEFGPGWYQLVDGWFRSVDELLSDEQAAHFQLEQVREKHGRLQIDFHLRPTDVASAEAHRADDDSTEREQATFPMEQVRTLTVNAQERSLSTCYFCGQPGVLRPFGWKHVSCDSCARKLGELV